MLKVYPQADIQTDNKAANNYYNRQIIIETYPPHITC